MSKKIDTILYRILTEEKNVEKAVLDRIILKKPGASGALWISELVSEKLINESDVLRILAEKLGIEYKPIKNYSASPLLFNKIPIRVASHYQFAPILLENNTLTIAVYYPIDIKTQDEIRFQLGHNIHQVLADRDEILEVLRKNYGLGARTVENIFLKDGSGAAASSTETKDGIEDIEKLDDDGTVANLVNQIIFDAYKKRATDIHIEPYRGKVRFRYRIDSILYDANVSPSVKHFVVPILSRIKIMSNLNIVEHRLPQDGQAVVNVGKEQLDLRVSFIPTPFGESVVIRILPTVVLYNLEKMGLSPKEKGVLERLLESPNGIIFVTGPTGSGKTTTLYAFLMRLNTKERKIITIEDPIEYEIDGVTQIQIAPQIGLDFAAGLRSMLRHDPDVMMVGEVRDKETAEIAVRVALTGHLVFSTLHTNSAAASVHRLLDIGIEPYLIYSSTIAFIAQRLVRVLCPKCKYEIKNPDPVVIDFMRAGLKINPEEKISIYNASGCDYCNKTGFYGRSAIYEILLVGEPIRDLIQQRASAAEIEALAVKRGMKTLLENGLKKVIKGITTIQEVTHILSLGKIEMDTVKKPADQYIPSENRGQVFTAVPGNDKRVYTRMKNNSPMVFSIHKGITHKMEDKIKALGVSEDDLWQEHEALIDDISAGGLTFNHELPLIKDLVLKIRISFPLNPGEPSKTITCMSKIVRLEESQDGLFRRIAVCFLDMSSADRSLLDKFIEKMIGNTA